MKKTFLMTTIVAALGLLLLSGCQKVELSVSGELNGHSYVDLVLPSGTLWATCNVGANNPEDEGNRYAWGETRTKGTDYWDNYKYCKSDRYRLTKYCSKSEYGDNSFTDNLTRLVVSDDAATVIWGDGWRTPSDNEFRELFSECSWEEKDDGVLFIGSNGNMLFLPFSYFWTSKLNTEHPDCAYCVSFWESIPFDIGSKERCYGETVRPVCSLR